MTWFYSNPCKGERRYTWKGKRAVCLEYDGKEWKQIPWPKPNTTR